ncbi:Protein of unknown function [Jatrophihabitans endophyticus]|uniref:Restriction endonuclease type II-like domain-containing protein n=1 Tax=Jatrophihabitans endophyticus TaxID=1206085 RepID=A0A1M5GFT8_9ACTN|nr:Protein of unknown function [Jatrophihabitans endophyticus]
MIGRAQLRGHGLSDPAVSRLVEAQALHPIGHGVFLVRGAPLTYRATLWSAVVASDGVLAFGTAAHLWGVVAEAPARVDVLIARHRRVRPTPQLRPHRITVAPSVEVRLDGLPVTSRTHTLLDYLGRQRPGSAQRLADRALQRGWLRPDDLAARLRDSPGRTGNTMLRTLLERCGDGAAAESERVLHRLLRRAGISRWVPNYPLWVDGELAAVLDVALPDQRLAIEVDGWAFHSDVDRFQRDRTRQNRLVALGWTVLRFTWADLVERPGSVVATIRRQVTAAG